MWECPPPSPDGRRNPVLYTQHPSHDAWGEDCTYIQNPFPLQHSPTYLPRFSEQRSDQHPQSFLLAAVMIYDMLTFSYSFWGASCIKFYFELLPSSSFLPSGVESRRNRSHVCVHRFKRNVPGPVTLVYYPRVSPLSFRLTSVFHMIQNTDLSPASTSFQI